MNRTFTALLALVPSLVLAACGGTVTGGLGYTKDEARAMGGVDPEGKDLCAAAGWYADGVCDDFCQAADPECAVTPTCPSEADPSVHYVATDFSVCMAAKFACPSGQVPFSQPDCGCGCIEQGDDPVPACGGLAGVACAPGYFCNYAPEAMCGAADQMGTCELQPDACPEYYGPVCGCDGQTYDNSCFAAAAGVSVVQDGACAGGGAMCGGFGGFLCGKGEFCDYALSAQCGAGDMSGECKPIPEACAEIYAPVCGCDGQTYSNACSANGAGVAVAADGECAP